MRSLTLGRLGCRPDRKTPVRLQASEALAAHGVEGDHVQVWQAVGQLQS
jgi:hypothetical protein